MEGTGSRGCCCCATATPSWGSSASTQKFEDSSIFPVVLTLHRLNLAYIKSCNLASSSCYGGAFGSLNMNSRDSGDSSADRDSDWQPESSTKSWFPLFPLFLQTKKCAERSTQGAALATQRIASGHHLSNVRAREPWVTFDRKNGAHTLRTILTGQWQYQHPIMYKAHPYGRGIAKQYLNQNLYSIPLRYLATVL